jgi:superfamily II DNA or RNA helicase
VSLRPLRPHQERAIAQLRRSLASGHKRPMLQAPTGFGKTLTAAHIVAGALGKGKRVAFCVPRLTLIDQTVAAFENEGISAIGVMQGKLSLHAPFRVRRRRPGTRDGRCGSSDRAERAQRGGSELDHRRPFSRNG